MLSRAAANFRYAEKNYRSLSGDELELNFIGYSLQQACELCIKHCMEINGVRYPHAHIIEDLLDECESSGVEIRFSDEFYNFAPAITKWESKTRYIKNYVLTKRQIDTGFKLIREFLISNGLSDADLKPPQDLTNRINCF